MSKSVLILPGDGIGPEIVTQAEKVLNALVEKHGLQISTEQGLIGGSAIDETGVPLPDETLAQGKQSDAILLGAVGGPKWDKIERSLRPERGLLAIRAGLDLYANLRPVILYKESEIERIAHTAFNVAMKRNKKVCSVDKANVLEATELWREVVTRVAKDYPEISLEHMYVDNAAMQLVRDPGQFDVIVTTNMFGDILSDLASMLTGSIGMLPSASLNADGQGMYEPIHGSAPDIAGKNIANPLATIISTAMMLRYSLAEVTQADRVEQAVQKVLASGIRTADIISEGMTKVSTSEMGDAVVAAL